MFQKCASFLLALLIAALSLSPKATADTQSLSFHGFDPKQFSPPGQEGLQHLFEGDGFVSALPFSVLTTLSKWLPPELDTPEGQFLVFGHLPSPPTRENGIVPREKLPLGQSVFIREGAPFINSNCLYCHAGVVRGVVTAGLANSHIDQVANVALVRALLFYYKNPFRRSLPQHQEEEFNYFSDFLEMLTLPTQKFAQSRGENFGPYGVSKYMSRLKDPARLGLVTYEINERAPLDAWFEGQRLVTVDSNPWWHLKYKKNCYWYRDGGPYRATHFAVNFTTPRPDVNEQHEAHVKAVAGILAYARELDSPAYPQPLNGAKVKWGAELFHGRVRLADGGKLACSGCHGVYTKLPEFSDARAPGGWEVKYDDQKFRKVGTDPEYSRLLVGFAALPSRINQTKIYFEKRGKSELSPQFSVPSKEDEDGYIPPPLVGVWATAPYFHNGSVPALAHVLDSKTRPKIWKRSLDPFAYDHERVGLVFEELSEEAYAGLLLRNLLKGTFTPEAAAVRAVTDTTKLGKSNAGHTFGDKMNAEERGAVIEFLKSLSGPSMPAWPAGSQR